METAGMPNPDPEACTLLRKLTALEDMTTEAGPKKRRRCGKLDFTSIQITPPRRSGLTKLAFARPKYNTFDVDPSKAYFTVKLPAHVNVTVEKPSSPQITTQQTVPPNLAEQTSKANTEKKNGEGVHGHSPALKRQGFCLPTPKPSPKPANKSYIIGDVVIPHSFWLPSKLTEDNPLDGLTLTMIKSLKVFDDTEIKAVESFTSGEAFQDFKPESAEYQKFFRNVFNEFKIDPNSMIDFYSPASDSETDYVSL